MDLYKNIQCKLIMKLHRQSSHFLSLYYFRLKKHQLCRNNLKVLSMKQIYIPKYVFKYVQSYIEVQFSIFSSFVVTMVSHYLQERTNKNACNFPAVFYLEYFRYALQKNCNFLQVNWSYFLHKNPQMLNCELVPRQCTVFKAK